MYTNITLIVIIYASVHASEDDTILVFLTWRASENSTLLCSTVHVQ